ncbi:TPA: hypothetical protein ACH3X2_003169, partial [Trebouxia sp. C0005]
VRLHLTSPTAAAVGGSAQEVTLHLTSPTAAAVGGSAQEVRLVEPTCSTILSVVRFVKDEAHCCYQLVEEDRKWVTEQLHLMTEYNRKLPIAFLRMQACQHSPGQSQSSSTMIRSNICCPLIEHYLIDICDQADISSYHLYTALQLQSCCVLLRAAAPREVENNSKAQAISSKHASLALSVAPPLLQGSQTFACRRSSIIRVGPAYNPVGTTPQDEQFMEEMSARIKS